MNPNKERNTVVIIDDDHDLLKLLTMAFQAQGFQVVGLDSGKAAFEYFTHTEHFDSICLIILDRMLGDMDGLDVLVMINKNTKMWIPLLILSVLSAEKDMIEGLKNGALDYIGKPFSLPILLQQATALIKQASRGR